MPKARVVTLTAGAASAVVRGHPWIWRQGLSRAADGAEMGDVVEIRDAGGAVLGQGLWDPSSPLAVRLYARTALPKVDEAFITTLVAQAIRRRDPLAADPNTTAYRLCNGEGDRVPGVVIDRYDHVAVLRLDGDAIGAWLKRLTPLLGELLRGAGVRSVAHRIPGRSGEGRLEPLSGDPPPDSLTVRENGIAMVVDVARGQKTGAFLDQRDNRARVRELAANRRVLNLFSYAGGFSTAAALGGATHVTSVDIAQSAHGTAQRSMRENGVDSVGHAFVTADAFAFLGTALARKEKWDLVISDPPSFAPNEKAKQRALVAYRRLHAACSAVLAEGGVFCASSCSSHVNAEDFLTTLDDASLAGRSMSLVGMFGHPYDHPTLAGWPEGRYLKFAVLR
ncbi:MAG TPA: class I SAM-dependent rRNA methyltransferase [Polyangiaceae bacterium]|nr:class I SAM-dependent rRNA methyltransferase [Polyangiaceae bacterium]